MQDEHLRALLTSPVSRDGDVSRYVALVAALGGGVLVASLVALVGAPPAPRSVWAVAALLGAGLVATHVAPLVLPWRRHTVALTMDEPVVLVGLLVLPSGGVGLVVAAAVALAQPLRRRPFRKGAFNVAVQTVSTGVAWGVFFALDWTLDPLLAAFVAVCAFAAVSHLLVGGVFALLERASFARVVRERVLSAVMLQVGLACTGGVAAIALWRIHPAATLAVVPLAWAAARVVTFRGRAERVVATHEALLRIRSELPWAGAEADLAERVLAGCAELLPTSRATLVLDGRHGADARMWSRQFHPVAATWAPLETPIVDRTGRRVGLLRVELSQSAGRESMHVPTLGLLASEVADVLDRRARLQRLVSEVPT